MQRIAIKNTRWFNLLFAFLFPSVVFAGNAVPEDYFTNKPLVLEIRYCECQATNSDSASFDLLPSFLKESSVVKVGVSEENEGFVSSREFSIGYDLKPVTGAFGQFHFNYAGSYVTSHGSSAGSGALLLIQDQWVTLFGSQHEADTGAPHSNVAVRLTRSGGS